MPLPFLRAVLFAKLCWLAPAGAQAGAQDEAACQAGKDATGQDDNSWLQHRVNSILRPRVGAKEDKEALIRSFIDFVEKRGSEQLGAESSPPRSTSPSSDRGPPQRVPENAGIAELFKGVEGQMRHRSFEQCPKKAGGPRDVPAESMMVTSGTIHGRDSLSSGAVSSEALDCGGGWVIGHWDADAKYVQSCCYFDKYCAGCAVTADGTCGQCASGYVLQANKRCIMCDSVASWRDADGKTCDDYESEALCKGGQAPANDTAFKGLRPSDACCACGGGELAATPWQYGVSDAMLTYSRAVSTRPSPQTADRYEVQLGCALEDLGLTLGAGGVVHAMNGSLPAFEKGFAGSDMECKVTAIEDASRGIQSSTMLEISVQPMSYGPKVILFSFHGAEGPIGQTNFPLMVSPGLSLRNYELSCMPSVQWITVDSVSGALSYHDDGSQISVGGLSGKYSGFDGGECAVRAVNDGGTEVRIVFAVLRVQLWTAMQYEVEEVSARVGVPIPGQPLIQSPPRGYGLRTEARTGVKHWYSLRDSSQQLPVPKSLPPELLDVQCSGADHIRWSRQTGEVTIDGQLAFVLDPVSGEISGTPQVDLGGDLGRSTLAVTCHVAAGGSEYASPLTTAVRVEIADDVCFFRRPNGEPIWAVAESGLAPSTCRAQCRKRADCGGYVFDQDRNGTDRCLMLTSGSEGADLYMPSTISIRALCQPGRSCLSVQSSEVAFLEGLFCPQGTVKVKSDAAPQPLSTLYSRSGLVASAEFFLARSPCPLLSRQGKWVVRKPSPLDHMDPVTGVTELNGEVVACVVNDIETETFNQGNTVSVVYLPEEAFSRSQYEAWEARNAAGDLSVTVSLTSQDCGAPATPASSEPVTLGNVSSPGSFSLDVCECFGEAYSKTAPVTDESAGVVPPSEDSTKYNSFQPLPQLLLEGPYSCGKDSVLPFGTFGGVSEDACKRMCLEAEEPACLLFAYTPAQHFCQLLSGCDSLGYTGLEFSQRVFGVFRSSNFCRVADPEACWVARKRRALLDGSLEEGPDAALPAEAEVREFLRSRAGSVGSMGPVHDFVLDVCAFQDVLAQCDTMQIITTESPGRCGFCEFFPVDSKVGHGRAKTPPPPTFPGGSQLTVGCDNSEIGSRLLDQGLQVGSAVVDRAIYTCVDGAWRDKRGEEGLKALSCVGCVQMAQRSYAERLQASLPEVYFLSRRELQYHFNTRSWRCRATSDATSAPLRNEVTGARYSLDFQAPPAEKYTYRASHTMVVMRQSPDYAPSWFLSPTGTLQTSGPYKGCLKVYHNQLGKVEIEFEFGCDMNPNVGYSWQLDDRHRLVNLFFGMCLAQGDFGKDIYTWGVTLQDCDDRSAQRWFFDGGDCRFQLELASEKKPLTWLFKAPSGSYFGAQESHQNMTNLSEATKEATETAFGSCRISVSASLQVKGSFNLSNLERTLELDDAQGDPVEENYSLAYALYATAGLTGDNFTVFACYPLDFGGAKALGDLLNSKSAIEDDIALWKKYSADSSPEGRALCLHFHCSFLIHLNEMALSNINKKIDSLPAREAAVCALDLPVSAATFSNLAVAMLEEDAVAAMASSRCRLLHRGHPGDLSNFELTWAQMADVLRDQMYSVEEVAPPTDMPFNSKSEDPASAAKVGFLAMLNNGATVWGIKCKPGAVVAVNSNAGSPHCVHVEAVEGDLLLTTLLPDSAVCDLGYAVGGWYNLGGSKVQQRNGTGPSTPTGFLLYCRYVPGLSRLCDVKYSRCDPDEVVAGVLFDASKSMQYKCCHAPKPLGFVLASEKLLDVRPWEGYYCPAAVGDTGRPQYRPTRLLGVAPSDSSTWWPQGQRQTSVGSDQLSARNVSCDVGEFLTTWRVHKRGADKSLVAFTCVKLGFPDAEVLSTLDSQPTSLEQTASPKTWDGFNVTCEREGHALTGWRLVPLSLQKFSLAWTCSSYVGRTPNRADWMSERLLWTTGPTDPLGSMDPWSSLNQYDPFACPVYTVMRGIARVNGGFELSCAYVRVQASLGEGQVLRWNKFWATWVLDQIPVTIKRNPIISASDRNVGSPWGALRAQCGYAPPQAGGRTYVSALQSWRFITLGQIFPFFSHSKSPSTASSEGAFVTSEFRCRATSLGGCYSEVMKTAIHEPGSLLNNLSIECPADQVLTHFGFEFDSSTAVYNQTRICCQAKVTQCKDHKAYLLEPMDLLKLAFTCGDGQVLQQLSSNFVRWKSGNRALAFRCCEAPHGALETVSGFRSSASQPEDDPSDSGLATVVVDGGTFDVEVTLGGKTVVLGTAGSPQLAGRVLSPSGALSGSEIRDLPHDLNVLEKGSVVVLGGHMGIQASEAILWALQRCGARAVSNHAIQASDHTYALVGVVGGEAVAEAFGDYKETLTLKVPVPRPFTVAPIVDFSGVSAPPRREPPKKPELLKFQARQPVYDQFCDLPKRTFGLEGCEDGNECPDRTHPCFHTWHNKITEFQSWGCNQRDVDREYVDGTAEVQRLQYEAESERLDFFYELAKLGVQMVASAATAWAPGSWAVPASEGAEAATEGAETGARQIAGELLKRYASKRNKLDHHDITIVMDKLEDQTRRALAKRAQKELKDQAKRATVDALGFGAGRLAQNQIAKMGVKSEAYESAYESNKQLTASDGTSVEAVPELEEPDMFGFSTARNYDKINKASWLDCHPLQWGLSKLACDLYCTESAVKEGNAAVLSNMEESQDMLTRNLERLLDYHSKLIIYSLDDMSSRFAQKPDAESFLFKQGSAAESPHDLDLARTRAALRDLQALPQLLVMNVSMLRASGARKLPSDVVEWHAEASDRLLDRLHALLGRGAAGDVPEAVRQAAGMVRQFNASRSLRLSEAPAHPYDALQKTTSKKARALRAQIRSHRELLQKSSDKAGPLQNALSLDLEDDAVVIRWNQLAEFFVAAHERHAVFVQARARALAASDDVLRNAEHYVGCGQEYGSIQESWRRARRLDDEAAGALLRAWAATVAAQERLQLAVDAGLVERFASSAALRSAALLAEEVHTPCRNATLLAEEAHATGVQKVDGALFPLLQQVIVLERLAKYQEGEIRSKKLQGVERVPTTPTLEALARAARAAADPATAAGSALAARALERLVPRPCRAPGGLRGLSKKASVVGEVVRLLR